MTAYVYVNQRSRVGEILLMINIFCICHCQYHLIRRVHFMMVFKEACIIFSLSVILDTSLQQLMNQ